jgi:hypothetical protein
MGQRLIITEEEKISIQQKYGITVTLVEQSENSSKEEIFQKLINTFKMGEKTKEKVNKILDSNFGKMSNKALITLLIPMLTTISACHSSGKTAEECEDTTNEFTGEFAKYKKYDGNGDGKLDDYEKEIAAASMADSLISSGLQNARVEKSKYSEQNSGIEIINVKITHNEYNTRYDNITVNFKNNNDKTISAIQFIWYDVKNAFDEPVDPTYDGGTMEKIIKPGVKTSGEWETYNDDIVSAKVYVEKIMFTDGTKWENK